MKIAQNICEPHGGVEHALRTLENNLIVHCKNGLSANASKMGPQPGK